MAAQPTQPHRTHRWGPDGACTKCGCRLYLVGGWATPEAANPCTNAPNSKGTVTVADLPTAPAWMRR